MDDLNLGILLLRLLIGLVFAGHGWVKLQSLDGTAGWFDSMGMRPGRLHARLAASTEIGAGLLFALGLLTPFAAAGIIGTMVVAAWTVHRANGFWSSKNGWEINYLFMVPAIAVATTGPGEWSVDDALDLAGDLNGPVGLAIALVLGIGGGVAQLAAFYRPPVSSS